MKHIGIFKADTFVSIMNWVGVPLVLGYAISMLIIPWFGSSHDWEYVQRVWDRWQTVNAGVLAFISSVIAFNISKYNENKQKERRFIAARSFLPQDLSDLTSYCRESSTILREARERLKASRVGHSTPWESQFPELPESYREVFSKCIEDAEPDFGEYLAHILVRLQIHHSRLRSLVDSISDNGRTVITQETIKSYLFSLAQIQAFINRIFDFSRGFESFNGSNLDWEDYKTAYRNLDIEIDGIDDLEEFTRRAIARSNSNQKS